MPVKKADNLGNGTHRQREIRGEGRWKQADSKCSTDGAFIISLSCAPMKCVCAFFFFFSCHTTERQKLHSSKVVR